MKINIICSRQNELSVTDANILIFLFKKIKHKIEPIFVHINSFKCEYASINIFIGAINPILTGYAKTNILLFDGSIFPKANTYLLRKMDYIFTKTDEITNLIRNSVNINKIKHIGWRSTDLRQSTDIDYRQALLFCHDVKEFKQYQKIINTWNNSTKLTNSGITLNIVNFELCKMKESDITNASIVIKKNLSQSSFETVFNNYGIHICLDTTYNFSHYLNQSMLCKSVIVCSDNEALKFADGDYVFSVSGSSSKHKKLYGTKFNFSESNFVDKILDISRLSDVTLGNLGNQARSDALKKQALNDHHFKETMTNIIKTTLSAKKQTNLVNYEQSKICGDESVLPSVSIVTLTHNRKKFFNLAILNYNQIDYPRSKLEWIIYDTSNDENCVEDLLPIESKRSKYNIKYIKSNVVESIGMSRNNAIKDCNNDIVIFYDDDDYYPSTSVKNRISPFLIDNTLTIVGCSTIGCFEINKYLSYVDYPNFMETLGAKKLKIASLAIKREILSKTNSPCDDSSINEMNTLVSNNLVNVGEINWEETIISLVHSQNTTWRPIPQEVLLNQNNKKESEFSFGSKMFKFLTELDITDEKLKEREELKKKKIEELEKQQQARSTPTTETDSSITEPSNTE